MIVVNFIFAAVSYSTMLQQYTLQGPQPATFLQDVSSSEEYSEKMDPPTIEGVGR